MGSATDQKLDRILSYLEETNTRISRVEATLNTQQEFINQLSKSSLERYVEKANVEEACGVDPNQIRRNQLMGEIPKLTNAKEDVSANMLRQEKQSLGAKLYAAYCWFFVVLMTMSFLDRLPVFDFEIYSDERELEKTSIFMRNTLYIPVFLSVLYVVVIFGIQKNMTEKKPFDLRYPLAAWSLALGLFSLFGSLRTVPALVRMVQKRGFGDTVCGDTRRDWLFNDPAGFWTFVFILSKVPELIDTLFIVLRKRKLITLHWYHHITVMLYCWHSWATYTLSGIYFSAMNLTVHAFMYIFYFLAAIGFRPTAFAKYITILQIAQMFVGTAIAFYTIVHMTILQPQPVLTRVFDMEWNIDSTKSFDGSAQCKVSPGNAMAGFLMYSSYLWLFCVFFYYAYLKPHKGRGHAKEE